MAKHEIDLPETIHIDQVRTALKALGIDIDPEDPDFGVLSIDSGTVGFKRRIGPNRIDIAAEWWIDGTHPF